MGVDLKGLFGQSLLELFEVWDLDVRVEEDASPKRLSAVSFFATWEMLDVLKPRALFSARNNRFPGFSSIIDTSRHGGRI